LSKARGVVFQIVFKTSSMKVVEDVTISGNNRVEHFLVKDPRKRLKFYLFSRTDLLSNNELCEALYYRLLVALHLQDCERT